jgi:putative membrane protein
MFKELQKGVVKYSSNFMRLYNEGATVILFAIVFLVILKNAINWIYGVVGVMLFSMLIVMGYKFYKRFRERSK